MVLSTVPIMHIKAARESLAGYDFRIIACREVTLKAPKDVTSLID
jgi:hypothetical protein